MARPLAPHRSTLGGRQWARRRHGRARRRRRGGQRRADAGTAPPSPPLPALDSVLAPARIPHQVSKHIRHTTLPQETPLHSAARLVSPVSAVALVSLLIGARADPDRTDQFGQRPLHVAAGRAPGGGGSEPCHGAEEQLLRLLCPLAATARAPDGAGITPIERARRTGSARAERVLAELARRPDGMR